MCKRVERICQVDPEGWYAPVIGQELVRCKDCKYWESEAKNMTYPDYHKCRWYEVITTTEVDFCRHGNEE